LWDELAAVAWLDPSLITAKDMRYLDVNLNRGAGYGDTLSWSEQDKPKIVGPPVEIQVDLDMQKFYNEFVELLAAPTPKP
jgi:inosine-uridine nucleoside N-ribohydrolase